MTFFTFLLTLSILRLRAVKSIQGGSIVADVPAFVIPYSLVRPAALLSTRRILAVRPRSQRTLVSPGAGHGQWPLPCQRDGVKTNLRAKRLGSAMTRYGASSSVRVAAAPLGCAALFAIWRCCSFYALRTEAFCRHEVRRGITTFGVHCVPLKRWTVACQNGSFAVFCGQVGVALCTVFISLLICRYSCRQIQLQTLLRYGTIKLAKSKFEKDGDCMKQIIVNYLFIFGLPVIIGLAVRIILQRFNKAYLATALFAILTAIGWCVANTIPSYGSELHAILAIQATAAFVSSLLTGLILRLKK